MSFWSLVLVFTNTAMLVLQGTELNWPYKILVLSRVCSDRSEYRHLYLVFNVLRLHDHSSCAVGTEPVYSSGLEIPVNFKWHPIESWEPVKLFRFPHRITTVYTVYPSMITEYLPCNMFIVYLFGGFYIIVWSIVILKLFCMINICNCVWIIFKVALLCIFVHIIWQFRMALWLSIKWTQ